MDDATLKRLGIRRGDAGKPPKMRYWAKHGTREIEAFALRKGARLEVHVDGKLTRKRELKTPDLAEQKYFWAQYWARNAVDQFLLKLIKKVTAEKRKSGAIPKAPKIGFSFYTDGQKSVVLAHAPEGLARFAGYVSVTGGFVAERGTWKKGASAADAQKAAEALLKSGLSAAKPPAGLNRDLGWRLNGYRR